MCYLRYNEERKVKGLKIEGTLVDEKVVFCVKDAFVKNSKISKE